MAGGEHLLKLNQVLGTACYQTHGVPKSKLCESLLVFNPIPCALGRSDGFLALGIGLIASSEKESLQCTFSRRFWKGS